MISFPRPPSWGFGLLKVRLVTSLTQSQEIITNYTFSESSWLVHFSLIIILGIINGVPPNPHFLEGSNFKITEIAKKKILVFFTSNVLNERHNVHTGSWIHFGNKKVYLFQIAKRYRLRVTSAVHGSDKSFG